MTDLTEQWRKGELPEGYYYVKDGENMIAEYLDGYFYNNGVPMTSFSGGVDSILEKVPSYEEWQAKLEQNAQLKELLKECRSPINYALCLNLSEEEKIEFKNLLAKIDEVLNA